MIEDLAHGYRIDPRSLYLFLHSEKVYRAIPRGRGDLLAVTDKVEELFRELIEEQ
jgi:hypothetical protein